MALGINPSLESGVRGYTWHGLTIDNPTFNILLFIKRMRFKKIASVAASRVEQMRDLLIRWRIVFIPCDSHWFLQMGGDDQISGEGQSGFPAPHPVLEMLCNLFLLIIFTRTKYIQSTINEFHDLTIFGPVFPVLSNCNENVLSSFCLPDIGLYSWKYQDDNQQLTSVQVLCQGHGALVKTVSKFHPDPELDKMRHLDIKTRV